ncbi:MAG: lipoate-protein ligase B, partial [Methanobacteriota archaeon]
MNSKEVKTMALINLGRQPYTPVWEFQRMLQRARIEERIPDVLI